MIKVITLIILGFTLLLIHSVASFLEFPHYYHAICNYRDRYRLQYAENTQKVIQVGGGLPTVPSGGFVLFDPEETGKLKGSGQCIRRIHLGFKYPPLKQNTENNQTDIISAITIPFQQMGLHMTSAIGNDKVSFKKLEMPNCVIF